MLATGLAEKLIHMVVRQPFVIQHVKTRSLTCENLKFLMFLYSHQMKLFLPFYVVVFPLDAFMLLHGLSHKNAWITHYHFTNPLLHTLLTVHISLIACTFQTLRLHALHILWRPLYSYVKYTARMKALYG